MSIRRSMSKRLVALLLVAGCGTDDATAPGSPFDNGGNDSGSGSGDGDDTYVGDGDSPGIGNGDGDTSTGNGGDGGLVGDGDGDGDAIDVDSLDKFSFFVTSLAAMRKLSGSQDGFGGDLRFGETGANAGLRGADKICTTIAESSMPGSGQKVWRAFLSVTNDGTGQPVHAKDRVGTGPWYDRVGRLVAQDLTGLLTERPTGDTAIKNDLPNEDGVPNHKPDPLQGEVDNHDFLTGTGADGKLYKNSIKVTCNDWTKAKSSVGEDQPRVGHSWPRTVGGSGGGGGGFGGGGFGSMNNWMSALDEAGCSPGVSIVEMGPPNAFNPTVGSGGGYGGIYCFALKP